MNLSPELSVNVSAIAIFTNFINAIIGLKITLKYDAHNRHTVLITMSLLYIGINTESHKVSTLLLQHSKF